MGHAKKQTVNDKISSMKILNIMLGKGRGGLEQVALDYHHALTSKGHQVLSITHPNAWVKTVLNSANITTTDLSNMGEWDPIATYHLKQINKASKANIAICHGNRAIRLATKALRNKVPVVAVAHNYRNKGYENCNSVFCITEKLKLHMASIGIPENAIYHVPNMINVTSKPAQRNIHTPIVIGSLGRFVEKKGFDVFINALDILKQKEIPFKAVLAGDGPLNKELKNLIHRKGLSNDIHMLGWITNKSDFFDQVDIFALPSRDEAFGLVLIEALSRSIPCISTLSQGPSEILKDGNSGLLSPINNPNAFAENLLYLIENPHIATEIGKAGYITVRDKYSTETVSNILDLAVKSII